MNRRGILALLGGAIAAPSVVAPIDTALIAELVEALEHEVKRSRRHLAASTLATLAKLKGYK
jgi:hypothetical protein